MDFDSNCLIIERHQRLLQVMSDMDEPAVLTSNSINILYATGVRNMTVFSLMGPFRFSLTLADGSVFLWEFAGCEHLVTENPIVTDVRPAPGLTPISGPGFQNEIARFVADLTAILGDCKRIAIEGLDVPVSDALRNSGLYVSDATGVFSRARVIKQPLEISVMREAISRVEAAAASLETSIVPGVSEVEAWAAFHKHLIATEGEYVSTRLFQSGPRTFPYFQEAGPRKMQAGDLVCFDTDALGYMHYAVDFSRTFLCGDVSATDKQKSLYKLAYEQLHHNAALIGPGVTFENFAKAAWPIPAANRGYGYYCLGHGLGLCGEFPYISHHFDGVPYALEAAFEPGMVICIESYIGEEQAAEGVKLEDQFLITDDTVERLTNYPFCSALLI
ncbi:Xaa-Pro peptidase family protein [uncultured Roseibium sp.]|uniref:M24 family metallopeptidase n=1 Tax=uncultured Roseibium sp. TaxID=1936171 RepID=UPI002607ABD8|nr:Xaa-Pro peptidase family protein [uncultured Roseibium sp.]